MSKRGEINGYTCDKCGRHTYVVHVDDGVTPMFLACRVNGQPDCGRGVSLMYPDQDSIPQHVIDAVAWEWYMPSRRGIRRLDPESRQHVEMGGLLLRRLSNQGREALEAVTV